MSRILLIVGGGIAAYKAAELIRLLRKEGHSVTPVLTEGGAHFVTPMSLARWRKARSTPRCGISRTRRRWATSSSAAPPTSCWSLQQPPTCWPKWPQGIADSLATTLLLATDKPVVVAPAMNVRMWQHAATQRNIEQLKADGITVLEPDEGPMACGEYGPGRLPEPRQIFERIAADARAPRRNRAGEGPLPASMCWSPPARRTSRSTRCE